MSGAWGAVKLGRCMLQRCRHCISVVTLFSHVVHICSVFVTADDSSFGLEVCVVANDLQKCYGPLVFAAKGALERGAETQLLAHVFAIVGPWGGGGGGAIRELMCSVGG